jgi:hypothetical protein
MDMVWVINYLKSHKKRSGPCWCSLTQGKTFLAGDSFLYCTFGSFSEDCD